MKCPNCVNTIENYVGSQEGVNCIKVNLLAGTSMIEFDNTVNADNILEWTNEISFSADLVIRSNLSFAEDGY